MGWGAFKKFVKKTTKSVAHFGKKVFKSGGKELKKDIGAVYKAAKPVVNQVYKDGKAAISGAGKLAEHTVDTYAGTVQSLGQSFAWPLAIAGGGVAIFFLMSQRG
jgi:hypothetical protein